jgi:hypothetical protein
VEALRALSKLGCPMAEKSNVGRTAAFPAAQEGHVEALRVLSELGCPMVEKDTVGRTVAILAQGSSTGSCWCPAASLLAEQAIACRGAENTGRSGWDPPDLRVSKAPNG